MIGDASIQPTPGFSDPNRWGSTGQTKRPAAAAAAGASQESDRVEISSAGRLMESLAQGLFWGVEPRADGSIRIEDIGKAYEEHLSSLKSQVAGLLEQNGIDRSQAFRLTVDAAGNVVVAGDHPDKEKIEALFQDQPELANEFRHVSATASLLRAADESKAFQAAYAKDPQGAVRQYAHLFSGVNSPVFGLDVGAEAILDSFVKAK
ncbi:MAG: hypothetical protein JW809_17145 [Pirellulales bacterium]|nr:hypothetical protein [Pirellulales bacterium]